MIIISHLQTKICFCLQSEVATVVECWPVKFQSCLSLTPLFFHWQNQSPTCICTLLFLSTYAESESSFFSIANYIFQMEHPCTILLTLSTETKFCNLDSGKSPLATHSSYVTHNHPSLVSAHQTPYYTYCSTNTNQDLDGYNSSTSARSRQYLKSHVEGDKQSQCSLISKKFLPIFFYVDIQPQKNPITDMTKQGSNVLLLHTLICPGHYSFFWCQSLQTYPFSFVLLLQFMQLHSTVGYLLMW